MEYLGEMISIGVAFSWTIAAISSEIGSKHLGVFVMNVWRMAFTLLCSALLTYCTLGAPFPMYAGSETWLWLLGSGVVGYFFGDWCLFNSYLTIGAQYGQLFMTLAPMFAALAAWVALGQVLSSGNLLAMAVTLTGIAISVVGRGSNHKVGLQLPLKGVLFGIGAALGQGLGLVLSKIGMNHYTADVPSEALATTEMYLPFSANMIRCMAGFLCFTLWLLLRGEGHRFMVSQHDRRGMLAMLIAVLSGPFIGVGFSLMAIQYTSAGIASTLMAITPILILVPSHYIFHTPITAKSVVGALISVAGICLFFLL